ncbi:ATP-binding cassette domain-containing protein, partial [Microcella sp.]|uniref:ATP-binding cassette domain-containing protein n=1 Tax=Microcella sp. TaxID=1913979 RepID=UPI00299F7C1B
LGEGDPSRWRSAALASRFGVVFQNPEHQFVAATVRAELEVGGADAAWVDAVLDRLRLGHLADVSPYALSGGEQRRLSVATALAPQPPVLLLDEPTFGQDSRTWVELAALLAEHRDRGGAIVMATHDRELIEALDAREVALPLRDNQPPVAMPTVASRAERINPVAAIAASLLPAFVLVSTLDLVSAAVALGLQLVLIPFLGVSPRTLLRRLAPLLIAAPLAAATVVFYGRTSGTVYVEFLLVRISDGSLELALATLLRILAIGVPAIALFARPDATRLGDALGQNLRLPSRFVLGAVAALRLLTVLRDDARVLERAQRARGLADRGGVRRALGLVFALLVLSIRRGSALAIGMEARGVGAPGPRTWVRESPWRASDTLVVVIGVGISVVAVVASVLTGRFTGVFG